MCKSAKPHKSYRRAVQQRIPMNYGFGSSWCLELRDHESKLANPDMVGYGLEAL